MMKTFRKKFLTVVLALSLATIMSVSAFAEGTSSKDTIPSRSEFWSLLDANPTMVIAQESAIIPLSGNSYTSTLLLSRSSGHTGAARDYTGNNYSVSFTNVEWNDPTIEDNDTAYGEFKVSLRKGAFGIYLTKGTVTKELVGKNNIAPKKRDPFSVSFNNIGSGSVQFSFTTKNIAFYSDVTMSSFD